MRRLVDVAVWKDASNARPFTYEDITLTKYEGKLRFVKEACDPYGIESLSHIKEDCASQSLFVKVPGYSLHKAGEL